MNCQGVTNTTKDSVFAWNSLIIKEQASYMGAAHYIHYNRLDYFATGKHNFKDPQFAIYTGDKIREFNLYKLKEGDESSS